MKYGFIGCGNMGGAVINALRKSTAEILISDRSGKGRTLAQGLGISYADNKTIASECDRIFLCVKPYMMEECLESLKHILSHRKPLLITMAGGLPMARIEKLAGGNIPVIRIMPNTPVSIGKGVIPYCANTLVRSDVLEDWRKDMAHCGILDPLDEHLMDAASALSGSGPAYAYVFMEALADGAVSCGLPRAKALEYAAATLIGAGQMYLATKQNPGALKDAVCSPNGSTIAGIRALEQGAFRGATMDCVIAAYNRSVEMGK